MRTSTIKRLNEQYLCSKIQRIANQADCIECLKPVFVDETAGSGGEHVAQQQLKAGYRVLCPHGVAIVRKMWGKVHLKVSRKVLNC